MKKPKLARADVSKVVVTPKMIEAGAATLARWKKGSEYDLAAAVYRAMAQAAPPDRRAMTTIDSNFLDVLRLLGHSLPKG
jgi:hypothetical protein